MARRQAERQAEGSNSGFGGVAVGLAEFAASVLGLADTVTSNALLGPGWLRRSQAAELRLTKAQRTILLSLPSLKEPLKGWLDVSSSGPRTFPFTVEDLAALCFALSDSLVGGQGRAAVKLMQVAETVSARLKQALDQSAITARATRAALEDVKSMVKSQRAKTIYQLKITLKGVKPSVWRRVLVADCSLAELHEVIQAAFGWSNSHLYAFDDGDNEYSDSTSAVELGIENASRARLSRVASQEKVRFGYTYDFGDNWEHEILVEKILPAEQGKHHPVCLKGKRACPPEDIGGCWGYADLLDALSDPKHEQHHEFLELRGGFDPEAFDIEHVNAELMMLE